MIAVLYIKFSVIKKRKKTFTVKTPPSILIVDVLISSNPFPICRTFERRKRDSVNAVNYRKDVLINLLSLDQGLYSNARLKRHGLLLRRTHTMGCMFNRGSYEYAWIRAHGRFARAAINHGRFTLSYGRIYPSANYCNLG